MFREVKAAFRKLIIRRSKSSFKGDDQSRAEDHRQDQKSSVANRAPPPLGVGEESLPLTREETISGMC